MRTTISRQVELAGHSITLPKASPLSLFIEHLGEEIGDSLSIQVDTLYAAEQLAMQVASGKINYTVCTSEEAERFARLFPALDCTLPAELLRTHSLAHAPQFARTSR